MGYTIGVDFGTLSARAVLLRCSDGKAVAQAEHPYAHGVMDKTLPGGVPLEPGAALQAPEDYLEALETVVRAVAAAVDNRQILGLAVDFTAATVLAVEEDLTPLCRRFPQDPHAWVKLWKHHSAREQADRMTRVWLEAGVDLSDRGGRISSEWTLPKVLETLEKSPRVYENAAYFVDAGDWLTWQLTGSRVRSACMAGFKCHWNGAWPEDSLLRLLHPELDIRKLSGPVAAPGSLAGGLLPHWAQRLGLCPGTAVAVPMIDAHAAVPGGGIREDGEMMMILGTSACFVMMSRTLASPRGLFGRVPDGVLPGLYAYETGQSSLGDTFGWFVDNCVSAACLEQAGEQGIWAYLEQQARQIPAGENPVYALDWWNGSRSPYSDFSLTGAIFGCTLATRPAHIYRALMEASAFGTRQIFQYLEEGGLTVRTLTATGGIPKKNKLFMQILADVLNRPIGIADDPGACARGSGILGACAAGVYPTAQAAVEAMGAGVEETVYPDPAAAAAYEPAYRRYLALAEFFAHQKLPMSPAPQAGSLV